MEGILIIYRDKLIQRFTKLRAEIRQLFLDIEHWNSIHPDEKPIDPDPDGRLKRMADAIDKMLAREKIKVVS